MEGGPFSPWISTNYNLYISTSYDHSTTTVYNHLSSATFINAKATDQASHSIVLIIF